MHCGEDTVVEWLIGGLGGLLAALAIFVLHILVERQKPAAERKWGDALVRAWGDAGQAGVGGFLLVVLAIFMVDPDAGFRVLIVPIGAIGIATPLLHLFASWRAARDDSPRNDWWQVASDRAGAVMVSCCYIVAVAGALYFAATTGAKMDALNQRLQALESRQPGAE